MTTQTKVSSPVETTQGQIVKSYFIHILAAMAILIVGFFGGVWVANRPIAEAGAGLEPAGERVSPDHLRRPFLVEVEKRAMTNFLADNPELMVAQRYSAIEHEVGGQRAIEAEAARYTGLAAYYAVENQRAIEAEAARYSGLATLYAVENQRAFEAEAARYRGLATLYTPVDEKSAATGFLAANPELMVAQRYTGGVENEGIPGPSLLDVDPARLLTHRSAEIRQIAKTLLLAANPELQVAQRYATIAEQKADATFLAENPELSIVRLYTAQVEWNHLHHPGR